MYAKYLLEKIKLHEYIEALANFVCATNKEFMGELCVSVYINVNVVSVCLFHFSRCTSCHKELT